MQQNDRMTMMAEAPVHQVLVRMSLPMMISFFIQAMYNIVDSMFVARISEHALTAVSLAFPMQMIVVAISVGMTTGVSAVWARYMGMGRQDKASATIRTMTALCSIVSVLFIVLGIFVTGPLYRFQTDVADIAEMGAVYLTINWVAAFGGIFGKYYERLLVSSGRSILSMISMASGAVFNLIFDPLLIFGIGPFPALGVAGAAYATIGGQILAGIIGIIFNWKHNEPVRHDMLRLAFHADAALDILRVGAPTMLTMGLSSVTNFTINRILGSYSTTAIAVQGIWMKLQNFCYMPAFGLNNGMIPILSYNYGHGRPDRVRKTMNLAIGACAILMTVLLMVFELIPGSILTLFNAGDQMREIGTMCLRACVISLPFGAVSMMLSTSMQALDHSRYALLINLLRQCVLMIASFAVLSALTHSEKFLWFAVPTTEIITFAVSCLLNRRFRKAIMKPRESAEG
ncbi:MAG: MATE family efflux transporter [Oscillospiraceae bacterium]|nr:MATE family efflux transporter [Oscillospiraceae bacterium]